MHYLPTGNYNDNSVCQGCCKGFGGKNIYSAEDTVGATKFPIYPLRKFQVDQFRSEDRMTTFSLASVAFLVFLSLDILSAFSRSLLVDGRRLRLGFCQEHMQ